MGSRQSEDSSRGNQFYLSDCPIDLPKLYPHSEVVAAFKYAGFQLPVSKFKQARL